MAKSKTTTKTAPTRKRPTGSAPATSTPEDKDAPVVSEYSQEDAERMSTELTEAKEVNEHLLQKVDEQRERITFLESEIAEKETQFQDGNSEHSETLEKANSEIDRLTGELETANKTIESQADRLEEMNSRLEDMDLGRVDSGGTKRDRLKKKNTDKEKTSMRSQIDSLKRNRNK